MTVVLFNDKLVFTVSGVGVVVEDSNKKSLVYKVTIKSDGTLDKGSVALELPTGEVVSTISGYLGYILLGTNKDVRFCSTDSSNNLIAGVSICFLLWFAHTVRRA